MDERSASTSILVALKVLFEMHNFQVVFIFVFYFKALQTKIADLEFSKQMAVDECVSLQKQRRTMETDFEHLKQRNTISNKKALLESSTAFEVIVANKMELDMHVRKLKDVHDDRKRLLGHLKESIKALECDQQSKRSEINELNAHQRELENEIRHAQKKERGWSLFFLRKRSIFEPLS
jgi:chromosome segregation ATPase